MTAPPPLTPYLTVSDARGAIEFYKTALGATQDGEAHIMPNTSKIMHARVIVNGALIMIADDFAEIMNVPCMTPEKLAGSPIVLALQVDDARSLWDKAVAAGAVVTMPLADMFWGDRYGQFTDPFGHRWSISQTLKVMSDAEMQEAAQELMGKPKATMEAVAA